MSNFGEDHNVLTKIYSEIEYGTDYISDLAEIESGLEEIYRNSMLEDHVQNSVKIARCFIKGNYKYFPNVKMPVSALKDFIKVFRSVSNDKKKVLLNHLWQRFDTIERFFSFKPPSDETDDLPF